MSDDSTHPTEHRGPSARDLQSYSEHDDVTQEATANRSGHHEFN